MNRLYYGDNLTVLKNCIDDASVDLIYLDPPFNSQATYNVLFKSTAGERSKAQIEAFDDTWHWGDEAELAFDAVIHGANTDAAEMLRAMRTILNETDMMAYLSMMSVRLLELHRVLKPTGSLYLHCDPTASHYLRILMDSVFSPRCFLNEIVWKRTSGHNSAKRWGPVHDIILFYSKGHGHCWNRIAQAYGNEYVENFYRFKEGGKRYRLGDLTGAGTRSGDSGLPWRQVDPTRAGRHWAVPNKVLASLGIPDLDNLSTQEKLDILDSQKLIYWPPKGNMPQFRRFFEEGKGVAAQDVISDIGPLSAQQRMGYPTEKPPELLERIIAASSNEGDVVLDPFCGCGTSIHAAQKLKREWIGIDITHLAISLIEKRLKDAFPGIKYEVHGTPKDLEGARDLARRDKYQFQWWAVSLVDAVPFAGRKKGADSGIDGLIYFTPEWKKTEKAIVSVKGGEHVNVSMIRDLAHVVDREEAKIGIFITLAEPTGPMKTEAVKTGFYETLYGKYPKIQILTIAELFAGKQPNIPLIDSSSFKKAAKEKVGNQDKLRF